MMKYYDKSLFWNSKYTHTTLNSELVLFVSLDDFYVLTNEDFVKTKKYLSNALFLENDIQEIQIVFCIQNLLKANVLVQDFQEQTCNKPVIVKSHYYQNKFWEQNSQLQNFVANDFGNDIVFLFTHDFVDLNVQMYVKECINRGKQCKVVSFSDTEILTSPLIKTEEVYNNFVSCIYINAPQRVWVTQQVGKQVEIPCAISLKINNKSLKWLTTHAFQNENSEHITQYIYTTQKIKKHVIANYETLEQTAFLALDKELIIDKSSGYRTKMSSTILKDCQSQISTVSGVISPPKILASLDDVLVTYSCTYPTRIPFQNTEDKLFFNQSLGKGVHKEQSKISAIAEAFERFSINYNGKEEVFTKVYSKNLENYINPLTLCMFSDKQYEKGLYNKLERDTSLYWTQGISLSCNKEKYLPAVLCYQNAPFKERTSFRFSSNGCATGNTVKEAILQGLLELVERDAVALWWYQKRECPSVNLEEHQNWVRILENEGWKVWVLDVTTDIDIPVRVAVAKSIKTQEFRLGFGAHLDANIATARAISEVHQIIEVAVFAKAEFDFSKILEESYLLPNGVCEFKQNPNIETIDEAISIAQKKIEQQGFEVLYKNLSRSNLALKTVKVFVPGLCFIWPEFGNPRLYKNILGEVKFTEERLNPLALFV